MTHVFLVVCWVAYEGETVMAAYDNEPGADIHAAFLNRNETVSDVKYHVDEMTVQTTFEG